MADAYIIEVINTKKFPSSIAPWYLDSKASNHILRDATIFSSLQPSTGTHVISAGGHSHDVTRIGNVAIRLPLGEIQKINHVLYSLGIKKNLLSVGFLSDRNTV